jgi:transcriptional regulator with XRE-family HTH domain
VTISTKKSARPIRQTAVDLVGIGKRIRQIRGFELRQSDFAEMLGITQGQLSKYEVGQNAPTLEMLLKLKAHSGKSVDWILTGE